MIRKNPIPGRNHQQNQRPNQFNNFRRPGFQNQSNINQKFRQGNNHFGNQNAQKNKQPPQENKVKSQPDTKAQ